MYLKIAKKNEIFQNLLLKKWWVEKNIIFSFIKIKYESFESMGYSTVILYTISYKNNSQKYTTCSI